jgi:hypothetical protein
MGRGGYWVNVHTYPSTYEVSYFYEVRRIILFQNLNQMLHLAIDLSYVILLCCLKNSGRSEKQLVTGWTVRGSNPGNGEVFRTVTDWPSGPPNLRYNG